MTMTLAMPTTPTSTATAPRPISRPDGLGGRAGRVAGTLGGDLGLQDVGGEAALHAGRVLRTDGGGQDGGGQDGGGQDSGGQDSGDLAGIAAKEQLCRVAIEGNVLLGDSEAGLDGTSRLARGAGNDPHRRHRRGEAQNVIRISGHDHCLAVHRGDSDRMRIHHVLGVCASAMQH